MKLYTVSIEISDPKNSPKPAVEPLERGTCGRCRKIHAKNSCPAMGKTCLKCKKANHFANMCKTQDQKVHKVSDSPYQVSDSFVCRICLRRCQPNQSSVCRH